MSTYDDYDSPRERRRRDDRLPYPPDDDLGRRARPTRAPADTAPLNGSQLGKASSDIPPPPLGSAMKREGSRSRAPDLKPGFPDEASYLNGRSPDLERKNGDRDRRFRERRDGYLSDEGEALRGDSARSRGARDSARKQRPPYDDDDDRAPRRPPPGTASEASMPIRERPPRDREHKSEGEDAYDRRRPPRDYDDRRRRPARDYDEPPRRTNTYDDDEAPPRRRRPVEYGAEPVKSSRRDEDDRRPPRSRRHYDDDGGADDESRVQRRKSNPPPRRSTRYDDDDDDYYDRDPRDSRRRRDDYERDARRPARRRSYDDDDDYYRRRKDDDRDRRDGRDRRDDRKKEPTSMKIGNRDFGPALDKGQKYYASLAPILTPIVMNYLKNKK